MRYEERASLSRSQYDNFEDAYSTPGSRPANKIFLPLLLLAILLCSLFLFSLFAGGISASGWIVVGVFLLIAYSLGASRQK